MKVLVIGKQERCETYMPDLPIAKEAEKVYVKMGTADEEILKCAGDADVFVVGKNLRNSERSQLRDA